MSLRTMTYLLRQQRIFLVIFHGFWMDLSAIFMLFLYKKKIDSKFYVISQAKLIGDVEHILVVRLLVQKQSCNEILSDKKFC